MDALVQMQTLLSGAPGQGGVGTRVELVVPLDVPLHSER